MAACIVPMQRPEVHPTLLKKTYISLAPWYTHNNRDRESLFLDGKGRKLICYYINCNIQLKTAGLESAARI